jgi:hypothetical protein
MKFVEFWLNEMFWKLQTTPNYDCIKANGSNLQGHGTLKAATQFSSTKHQNIYKSKNQIWTNKLHSSDPAMSLVLNSTNGGGCLHMRCSKGYDHVIAGQSAPTEALAENAGT